MPWFKEMTENCNTEYRYFQNKHFDFGFISVLNLFQLQMMNYNRWNRFPIVNKKNKTLPWSK